MLPVPVRVALIVLLSAVAGPCQAFCDWIQQGIPSPEERISAELDSGDESASEEPEQFAIPPTTTATSSGRTTPTLEVEAASPRPQEAEREPRTPTRHSRNHQGRVSPWTKTSRKLCPVKYFEWQILHPRTTINGPH